MELNSWLTKINNLDNKFLVDKQYLINFIQIVDSKFLTFERYDNYLPNIKQKNDCIFIWDCEFQVFKTNSSHKKNKIQYEIVNGKKMIRCISEIGLIMLFNIKNKIYLTGLFHISLLNKSFQDTQYYQPFYHEYLSVNEYSNKKIMAIENKIYPHLIFEKIWSLYKYNNNHKLFQKNIIKLLKNYVLTTNKSVLEKFKNQLNDLINLMENEADTDKLISKIMTNLKSIIYSATIGQLNKTYEFNKIKSIYLNDYYIKSILLDQEQHHIIINNLNMVFSNGLNIVKGLEDIKALQNHNILLNEHYKKIENIIDIAEYNNKIYQLCGSAKLYESYLCLKNTFGDPDKNILNVLKKWMESNFKPHNPLVDAYYTLQVFILYNKNH